MSLDKPEEKAMVIEVMLHRIGWANWVWAFAERPLTVESARPALDRVLAQLAIGSEDARVFMLHFVGRSGGVGIRCCPGWRQRWNSRNRGSTACGH
jgi:hypothetical protein